jgi:hypothetical protein
MSDFEETYNDSLQSSDETQVEARDHLRRVFNENREQVFFSRQLEVQNEDKYFHWITNRAIHDVEAEGSIRSEWRKLSTGTSIKLVWHKSYRFYKRSANQLVSLVEEYSAPNIGGSLGLHGETMVLEGFARTQFVMISRDASHYRDTRWEDSKHNLDFIFERDGKAYGVEVKNTLGYMDRDEFLLKIRLCGRLGITPVFVCRMLPRSWIFELMKLGGFALILKYQLYPWTHRDLAKRVSEVLEIPVDAPRFLYEGTMNRFLKWHGKTREL